MLIDDYHNTVVNRWTGLAEEELLNSYHIDKLDDLPLDHLRFFQGLPFYYQDDNTICVHAGLDFTRGDPFYNNKELIWIRDWYRGIDKDWLGDRIIIHGHTILTKANIIWQYENLSKNQYLGIDCGAFIDHSSYPHYGHMCAYDRTNHEIYFQTNLDK